MPTYQKANAEQQLLLEDVRDEFHQDLVKAELRIGMLLAYGTRTEDGEITSPAITHNGVKCAGLAKITSLRERALGMPDAVVIVDGDRWPAWDEGRRRALLDHELQHFEIQHEPDSLFPKADDLGRPKLKIRPHDFEVGWFKDVAGRHGEASFEVEQAKTLLDSRGQMVFPWAPEAPARRPSKSRVTQEAEAEAEFANA